MTFVLQYLGNDPRVFQLYFTCKLFYGYYLLNWRQDLEFQGFEKFVNYGHDWHISLKEFNRIQLPIFFRMLFNGTIVCDFQYRYCVFNVFDLGYFVLPVNISKYFYIVKYEGWKHMHDISLYSLKKFKFHAKMNIISLNEPDVLSDDCLRV